MCCVPTVAAVPSSRRRPENHIRCVCVQLCVEKGCVPWSSGTCAPGELDAVIILIWMGEILRFFKHLLQTEGSCLCVPRTGGVERVCPRRFRNWPQGFRATCHPSTCALAMCVARKCSIPCFFPQQFLRVSPLLAYRNFPDTWQRVCANDVCRAEMVCPHNAPICVSPGQVVWKGCVSGTPPQQFLRVSPLLVFPRYSDRYFVVRNWCVPATVLPL